MLRKILKSKRAQNTAEYAILISLVVAGIVAMQTYAQRALQARVKDASTMLTAVGINGETTEQYEPYYLETQYDITRSDREEEKLSDTQVRKTMDSNRTRAANGVTRSDFRSDELDTELKDFTNP